MVSLERSRPDQPRQHSWVRARWNTPASVAAPRAGATAAGRVIRAAGTAGRRGAGATGKEAAGKEAAGKEAAGKEATGRRDGDSDGGTATLIPCAAVGSARRRAADR